MTWYHLGPWLSYLPLLALVGWAAVQDSYERRIPNWLTFTLVLSGIAQSFTSARTVTPAAAGLGFLLGFGFPFVLFAIRAIGAGDVKLLAGVGAWLGPKGIVLVFTLDALIGMAIVLTQCAAAGRLSALLRNTRILTLELLHVRYLGVGHVAETGRTFRSIDRPLPYAVPVLAATLIVTYLTIRGAR